MGEPELAEDGTTIWVPLGSRIYETTDRGGHWTSIATNAFAGSIGLDGGSRAIGVLSDSGCRQFKSDCYYYSFLDTTSDGGRTWHTVG